MTGDTLYVYQCNGCKTLAASTVKLDYPLKCPLDRLHMRFLYAAPVTTPQHRDIARRGLVFNPFLERTPYTKRPCETCRTPVERADMIDLPCVGKFCSEDCAQVGVLKHQQLMERIAKNKEEKPWLYL